MIASYTLLSAIGRLDVRTLGLNTPDYLPDVHYHQVRDAWHGVRVHQIRTIVPYRIDIENITIKTGSVIRITSGATAIPVTTTTASGFWRRRPDPGGHRRRQKTNARDDAGHQHRTQLEFARLYDSPDAIVSLVNELIVLR